VRPNLCQVNQSKMSQSVFEMRMRRSRCQGRGLERRRLSEVSEVKSEAGLKNDRKRDVSLHFTVTSPLKPLVLWNGLVSVKIFK